MQMNKESISLKLKEIEKLECAIETRVLAKATLAKDVHGNELTEENVLATIESLADQLVNTITDARPILISIMDGAMPLAQKLDDALIKRKYSFEFTSMQASSYQGTQSTGNVKIKAAPKLRVGMRTVVLVDDVCDTGNTCKALKDYFIAKGAEKVILLVLVDKKQPRGENKDIAHDPAFDPEISGLTLSKDDFIIGFGLDFEGGCRNLSSIAVVDQSTLPTPEEEEILKLKDHYNDLLEEAIEKEKALLNQAIQVEKEPSNYVVKTLFVNTNNEVEKEKNMVTNSM